MKLTIFGLTITSSWGNGHATLWRGLCRALVARGHSISFYERDVPYYANSRDLHELPGVTIVLYDAWANIAGSAERDLSDSDVGMVTSYCPDGVAASHAVLESRARHKLYYDLDTPVTLAALDAGEHVSYIGPAGLSGFDLVLSYTGGRALHELRSRLGARRVAALYGHVDPAFHKPVAPDPRYGCDLNYLGTYAADRQATLERLFFEPGQRRPETKLLIGGSMYPEARPWPGNVRLLSHVPPGEHPAFFSSSRLTLNVTRGAMARMGFCPSGRLFEAAACGAPLVSDTWEGLESFYTPGRELLPAHSAEDVLRALELSDRELRAIAQAGRDRTLTEHTAQRRALELENMLEQLSHARAEGRPSSDARRARAAEA